MFVYFRGDDRYKETLDICALQNTHVLFMEWRAVLTCCRIPERYSSKDITLQTFYMDHLHYSELLQRQRDHFFGSLRARWQIVKYIVELRNNFSTEKDTTKRGATNSGFVGAVNCD